MSVVLTNYHISSLRIENKARLENEQTMKFSFQRETFPVDDSTLIVKCTGKLYPEEAELAPDQGAIYIQISLNGTFTIDSQNCTREQIDNETAKALFPLIKTHIATATSSIGMNPILIPFNLSE